MWAVKSAEYNTIVIVRSFDVLILFQTFFVFV